MATHRLNLSRSAREGYYHVGAAGLSIESRTPIPSAACALRDGGARDDDVIRVRSASDLPTFAPMRLGSILKERRLPRAAGKYAPPTADSYVY